MADEDTMLQRLKQYACGICGSQPDQISHHKSHLETDKHKTKKELFKLQLEKLEKLELQNKYNTCDILVILEGVETITTDFILEDIKNVDARNKKKTHDKKINKKLNTKTKNTITQLDNLDNLYNPEHIARMEQEAHQANDQIMEISNRDALRDKIHEIHNYLRNNGAGYGMTTLKVFNIFYGLKKFEMCNNEYIKKLQPGEPDLYAKYKLNDKCRFSRIIGKIKYINDYKFNDLQYPEKPEYYDEAFIKYILDDVLDGINASMLNRYLMYEIPNDLRACIYKHIITEIDSIFDIEKQCNVLLSGKIYEYFIGRDETAISELGAYFTDRHIVNYIYDEKLKPKLDENGDIADMIDMFGGSGGFTTGYIDYLNKNYLGRIDWSKELKKVSHYDMNKDVVKSAWLEMFCLTGELPHPDNVKSANSFMNEFGNKKYKLIVTNPPYGGDKVAETDTQIKHAKIKEYIKKILPTIENTAEKAKLSIQLKEIEKEEKLNKQRLENNKVGLNIKGQPQRSSRRINKYAEEHNISTANDKESVSLIMLMDMLDIGGTACGVLKEGVFFNRTYKDIRKCLVENYNVREVISVSSDQFENTKTKTSILIFDNLADKKTSTVKFSEIVVKRYEEDKFIMQNGYVYLVENKGDIARIVENEISSATREELLKNPICSLNGKDYSKNTMEAGEGFKLVKLGDITDINMGSTPSTKNSDFWENGTISWVSIADLNNSIVENTKKKLTIKGAETMKNRKIPINSILLSFKLSIGKLGITSREMYCNEAIAFLNSKLKYIPQLYLYYILECLDLEQFGRGTIGSNGNLNKDILTNLQIPIPTTDQSIQQWVDKISKPFDDMNSKKKRISVLEEEVQNRIKEITENEDCDEVEFLNMFIFVNGKKRNTTEGKDIGLYPLFSSSLNIDNWIDEFDYDKECLIINTINGSGQFNIHYSKKFCATSNTIIFTTNKINLVYIYYYYLNNIENINNLANGSTKKKLGKTDIAKLKISIPKDKSLITALEPKFQEIEKLQNEVKQAEALYKQYLDELATAAIKKTSTPDITSMHDTTHIEPITQDTKSTEPTKPKKSKVSITKKKSPKANQIVDTSLDAILGASSS